MTGSGVWYTLAGRCVCYMLRMADWQVRLVHTVWQGRFVHAEDLLTGSGVWYTLTCSGVWYTLAGSALGTC
jgi:hypothetical protein